MLDREAVRRLDGKIVLVESAEDRGNPPAGARGTIEVRDASADASDPVVQIALEFPQMFTTQAHHRTILLTTAQVGELLASERNGACEIVLHQRLDADSSPGNERVAPRTGPNLVPNNN